MPRSPVSPSTTVGTSATVSASSPGRPRPDDAAPFVEQHRPVREESDAGREVDVVDTVRGVHLSSPPETPATSEAAIAATSASRERLTIRCLTVVTTISGSGVPPWSSPPAPDASPGSRSALGSLRRSASLEGSVGLLVGQSCVLRPLLAELVDELPGSPVRRPHPAASGIPRPRSRSASPCPRTEPRRRGSGTRRRCSSSLGSARCRRRARRATPQLRARAYGPGSRSGSVRHEQPARGRRRRMRTGNRRNGVVL